MTETKQQTFSAGQSTSIPKNTGPISGVMRLASNGRVTATASSTPPPAKLTPQAKMTG